MAITSANQLELLQTAEAVAREKMIDPNLVVEAMEESLARAAKSRYGAEMDIRVSIDRKTGRATFTRVRTVVADDERLTEHLKNEDFFHVEQFPTSEFASTGIVAGSDSEGFTHTVTGNLTIHGETKQVVFPANIEMADGGVKAATEFVINRQDFKIAYPGRADDLIQDNVAMNIQFVAMGA